MSTGKKLAWGAVPAVTDARASVAFYAGRMMKAYGSTNFYHSRSQQGPALSPQPQLLPPVGHLSPLTSTKCRAAILSAPKPRNRKEPDIERKITEIILHCAATPEGKDFTVADIDPGIARASSTA